VVGCSGVFDAVPTRRSSDLCGCADEQGQCDKQAGEKAHELPPWSWARNCGDRSSGLIRRPEDMTGVNWSESPPRTGLMYSQTMSPSGVTSTSRPALDSVISVLPLGSRCADERILLCNGCSAVP